MKARKGKVQYQKRRALTTISGMFPLVGDLLVGLGPRGTDRVLTLNIHLGLPALFTPR